MEVRTILKYHPLEGLSEGYLLNQNYSSSTIKSYKIAYKYYIKYLKENQIEYAKTSDVIDYREKRRTLGFSSHYIYIDICALKGLYRYLKLNQKRLDFPVEYAHDIMGPVKNEPIKARISKPILTTQQAAHLILHTKTIRKSIWHYRDHAIVYLMITSGLRSIEIIHAKREDYQVVDGQRILYIQINGQRSNREFVKIAPGAKEAIDDYLNKRMDDNPYLFITTKHVSPKGHLSRTFFKDMFARVLKECGLDGKGITPHCLRHTTAVLNLLRGGSLEQTRQLLRHVDIQSTLVYANHIERMKEDSEYQIEKFIFGVGTKT